jgi:hypothetical protein
MKLSPTKQFDLSGTWNGVVVAMLHKYGTQRITAAELAPVIALNVRPVVHYEDNGNTAIVRLVPVAEATRIEQMFQDAARRSG